MVDDLATSTGSTVQHDLRICAFCTSSARYKCPRCATPTCSLSCSHKHKQETKCTGEREKAQYIPMNAYGWGTMMRDYCYLEDIGRKVGEWGKDIARGGYTVNVGAGKTKSANAHHKVSRGRKAAGKSKRDVLVAHLESLGIDVELLPAGMERRNMNQSTFDQKSKCPLITIEFIFYPPATLASISSSPPASYNLLSHRNNLSATLLAVLQRQVSSALSKSQKQKDNFPDWLPTVVTPHPEAPECFVPPHCYIRANIDFPRVPNVAYYHKLDPTLSLSELLHRTAFIEFPTMYVFDPEASSFCGTVIDKAGFIVRISEDEQGDATRVPKRRKLGETAGFKAVQSLIGGYGSEGSSHSEEDTTSKHPTGLSTLEVYSGSDDEVSLANAEAEEDESSTSDDEFTEGDPINPTRLLELVKQTQSAADEDVLDWGDEWDAEAGDQSSSLRWLVALIHWSRECSTCYIYITELRPVGLHWPE
ncbi:hypothetical protein JVU11DRAFT_1441 [Chiua virens]|nr:hypothetical protein JVU11DRAFT_1441 [Chiua virens]